MNKNIVHYMINQPDSNAYCMYNQSVIVVFGEIEAHWPMNSDYSFAWGVLFFYESDIEIPVLVCILQVSFVEESRISFWSRHS